MSAGDLSCERQLSASSRTPERVNPLLKSGHSQYRSLPSFRSRHNVTNLLSLTALDASPYVSFLDHLEQRTLAHASKGELISKDLTRRRQSLPMMPSRPRPVGDERSRRLLACRTQRA